MLYIGKKFYTCDLLYLGHISCMFAYKNGSTYMIHDMMTFGCKIPKCATFDTTYSLVL